MNPPEDRLVSMPITTVDALEACVGTRPALADLKVIHHLDDAARTWLAASPLALAGFHHHGELNISLAGSTPGFAHALNAQQLAIPRNCLDFPEHAQEGAHIGLLFLIPSLGETLRINGQVAASAADTLIIQVAECYGHCAKAILRSQLWQADTPAPANDLASFAAQARFMGLATADAQGHTDLSPKGDPAGKLLQAQGNDLLFADRPGNRRTDSLRNLLAQPQAAALLICPGTTRVAIIKGQAQMQADPALCQDFAVQDKTPKLVTRLVAPSLSWHDSAALQRSRVWLDTPAPPQIDPAALFAAHVRQNKARGFSAVLAKAAVAVPGLMRKGLQEDYKRNLY